jgi:hypothetical protein
VKSILRRRPSPALVIALIALFISLSGVAYGVATGSIDSREIAQNTIRSGDVRNNEVRSRDLRNNEVRTRDLRNNEVRGVDIRNSTVQGREVALNTLTGDDIDESRLGKVPSATSADTAVQAASAASAASAQNSAAVDGMSVQKVFAKVPSGGSQVIFTSDYFLLVASCQGAAAMRLEGIAAAPVTNATVHSINQTSMSNLSSTSNLAAVVGGLDLTNTGQDGSATAAVSTTDGRVSTIVIGSRNAPAFQGESACAFRGTVTSG